MSNTYAGLGSGAAVSLNLNPQIATLQTWQNNINQAASSMQVTQTAMTQIQQIAANFLAQTGNLEGSDASEVDSVAAAAQQALVQVAELLDTQDGNTYVFAGQDTTNPPVPDPDSILSSGFYTQIAAQVGAARHPGCRGDHRQHADDRRLQRVRDVALLGLSVAAHPTLPPPPARCRRRRSRLAQGQTASVGLLASANSASSRRPAFRPTSTGSYMRDLMLSLATIGSMSSSQAGDAGSTRWCRAPIPR